MKELIAYCGLDCETCEARIATVNRDETLREKDGTEEIRQGENAEKKARRKKLAGFGVRLVSFAVIK